MVKQSRTGVDVRRRTVFAAGWLVVSLTFFVSLGAQEESDSTTPAEATPSGEERPTVPETVVDAPTLTDPNTVFPPGDTEAATPPSTILQRTPFASPRATGYGAPSSTTATLIDVPDLKLPGSVTVITPELIHDWQALRLSDVMRDVPGAAKVNDQLRPDAFFLRGFEARSRDFRKNGFLDPTFSPRDFANVERVEILRGPTSVLYGAGQPAGVINYITKKPLAYDYQNGQFQFGSFGLERYTVDSTGPVTEDGSLLYRLNAAYENQDGFRDFGYNERIFVAPVLSYVIDDDTAITWEGEYLKDRRRFDTGLSFVHGEIRNLPTTLFLGDPTNDFQRFQDWRQSMFLDHRLNDAWTLRLGGSSLFYTAPSSGTFPISDGSGTELNRSRQDIPLFTESYHTVIANLAGDFWLGGFRHKMVVGTEQGWMISNHFQSQSTVPGIQDLPIDAYNPDYSNPYTGSTPAVFDSTFRENRHGVYTQDMVEFNDYWSGLFGLRYDHIDTVFYRSLEVFGIPSLGPVRSDQSFDRFTPRAGLVYEPIPDVMSIFGSYSMSFDAPAGGPRLTTDPLKPELGRAWEVGTKWKLLNNLAAQATWFHITKENYTVDTTAGGMFVTTQIGQLTSQGVELSLLGKITERWSTSTNYTILDTLLSDPTNPEIDNRRARGVPANTANLWTRYNILQREQEVLGAGIGVLYVGDRRASFTGDVLLPAYNRWDAGLFYNRGRWSSALYLENLFDKRYYSGSVTEFQVYPGAPLSARAQVGVTF